MHTSTAIGARGTLTAKVIKAERAPLAWRLKNYLRLAFLLGWLANRAAQVFTWLTGIPTMTGELRARLIKADGRVINYGLLGCRVVTTAFVNYMVDQLQTETSTWGDFDYHDSGVGGTAEAVGDTGIETTDGEARVEGSQTEGGSANVYRSVGTISYTTTKAIVEHGLFNDLTAGTLLDRTVFSTINVSNGDSIQFTYDLTVTAGS